ncbi:bifunctional P-450:NADPH-P450 reductase [Verticillium dahliae VdLs.17]|uniref:Bifunctional P-450:NADPH-P450 reductase n=1 Tax=Verticillium dahliae (strain VdLs.17 / ATCC MYA-4575 / FGSC 10137) TaxID=498257 RepID=G2XBS7_VERDV|nr:bifunctional P-450:NADPH-P450 reductase [Verticillium dahliae VdLs.17]EGY16549.1 bifunctional P-450:NADPH-P450 reductase [Verticillium dahliae VdLs.17]KAH6699159.1 bifunctional P-450:NADPH-P450 reductase [Verticillium dahliae]
MSQPIPRPPGVPLLGNLFNVNPSNTWDSLKKLSEEYGEIFQIKVLGHGIVFVASAALAEELCDEKRFRKYVGGPVVEIRAAVHDALFTAYDHEESWGIAHRIIAPKLTPQSMADRFEEMRDTATELIDKWRVLGEDNEVSLISELNRLNLEATTLTLPGLVNWFLKGKFNKSIKVMRTYAQEMVDHRKAHPSLDGRNDLLSVLMNGKDPQTNQSLRESQVIDNIVSMPIGSSTAPALVSTAIYFLLKNPHVIVTARKEIEFVLAGGELTYAHLSQLHYIEGIMRESLRLSFAAPGFNIEPIPRENDTSPVVLGQGKYQVAHNQPMIIVLAGVNRDPAVFQDPLAFVPERMMGETFDNLPVSVKKWFGNGKRECIGKHYAWQWNMVALTKLIRGVNFAMVDPSYELKQDGWFNLRPVDFMVKVRPI